MPLDSAHQIHVTWMNWRFEAILNSSQEKELEHEINTWGPLLTSDFLQSCALVASSEFEYPEYYADCDLQSQLDLLCSEDGIFYLDLEKFVINIKHSGILSPLNDCRIIPAIFRAIDRYTEKHLVQSTLAAFRHY